MISYNFNSFEVTNEAIKIPKPICITINDFDNISVQDFREDFQKAIDRGQNIIPIYIDSYGGEVYSFLAINDIIKSYDGIVMTIGNGKCFSAGAFLLSAGSEGYRYCTENSYFMLHDISTGVQGNTEEIKNDVKHTERLNEQLYNVIDKNCNQERGYFKKTIKKLRNVDYFISPEKAKEMNLINHIGMPRIKFNVNCELIIEK